MLFFASAAYLKTLHAKQSPTTTDSNSRIPAWLLVLDIFIVGFVLWLFLR